MSIWNLQAEEYSKNSLWPWEVEVISKEEYARSLQNLMHFLAEVDVNAVFTLEDVSAVASLVGHDLYTLIAVQGKTIEKKTEYLEPAENEFITNIERDYVFSKQFGEQEFVATASNGHSSLSQRRLIGFQRYQREELRVKLPADRDIAFGNMPNVDESSIYAIDMRSGPKLVYSPVKEPKNALIQQGFFAVLKDAVRNIVAMLINKPWSISQQTN
ncbi:MAG: hypothetical protein JO125_17280 [Chloroflexi bacterium]|nr:hypothetical protein [Ktedonobacteraceae bacterium]MBV8823117.1 hypothetical protein [Ktedonobacteraceae bacterium]MBV9020104.1 hypothetical protein [Ktedonobacteraceae bacterium]MBV9709149.1 hypothetical protein [Chloroflexota bacterium]